MNSGKEDGDVVSPTHSRNNQRNHRSPKTPEDTPSTPQKRPVNPQGLREKRSVNQNDQQQQQNRGPRKPQKSSPTKEMSDLKNITVQISTDSGDGNEIRSVKCKKDMRFFFDANYLTLISHFCSENSLEEDWKRKNWTATW